MTLFPHNFLFHNTAVGWLFSLGKELLGILGSALIGPNSMSEVPYDLICIFSTNERNLLFIHTTSEVGHTLQCMTNGTVTTAAPPAVPAGPRLSYKVTNLQTGNIMYKNMTRLLSNYQSPNSQTNSRPMANCTKKKKKKKTIGTEKCGLQAYKNCILQSRRSTALIYL